MPSGFWLFRTTAWVCLQIDWRSPFSENLQLDDQIFLGVFAHALDQLLRLVQRLVGVVIERTVLHELTYRALAFIHVPEDVVEASDRVIQLLGERRILGNLAERTLAGIDLGYQLIGI